MSGDEYMASCVWIDPGRQSGTPCFGGTRVPVDPVVALADEVGDEFACHAWSVTPAHIRAGRAWQKAAREFCAKETYKTEDGTATPPVDPNAPAVAAAVGSAAESATGARTPDAAPSSQVSRKEAGQIRKGGGERCTESTAAGTGDQSPTQGEQASGALLARHLPCPVFATMLFDTLHVVRARQITAPEKRAVDDCITAVRDLLAKLGGRTEDR